MISDISFLSQRNKLTVVPWNLERRLEAHVGEKSLGATWSNMTVMDSFIANNLLSGFVIEL